MCLNVEVSLPFSSLLLLHFILYFFDSTLKLKNESDEFSIQRNRRLVDFCCYGDKQAFGGNVTWFQKNHHIKLFKLLLFNLALWLCRFPGFANLVCISF